MEELSEKAKFKGILHNRLDDALVTNIIEIGVD